MQVTLCDVCEKHVKPEDDENIEWQGKTFHPELRVYDAKASGHIIPNEQGT